MTNDDTDFTLDYAVLNDLDEAPTFSLDEQREARLAWVGALRSDLYQQTRGHLYLVESEREDIAAGNCCLGVACELFIAAYPEYEDIVEVDVATNMEHQVLASVSFAGEALYPPKIVQNWLGIDHRGFFTRHVDVPASHRKHSNLADANDSGATFAQIADMIGNAIDGDEDYKGLFLENRS